MIFGRQFVIFVLALLLVGVGCEKKKNSQLPRQAKVPVEPVPSPLPSTIPPENTPPPAPPPKQEAEVKPEVPKPQTAKKRKPRKQPPAQSTPPAQTATATPPPAPASNTTTVAAAHPPANPAEAQPDIAIAADVSSAQLNQQKQTTAQLIDATEKTIGGLHNLTADQEEILGQIRSYVVQSRKASMEGDFERAYNLATKAHLLSDALAKK